MQNTNYTISLDPSKILSENFVMFLEDIKALDFVVSAEAEILNDDVSPKGPLYLILNVELTEARTDREHTEHLAYFMIHNYVAGVYVSHKEGEKKQVLSL